MHVYKHVNGLEVNNQRNSQLKTHIHIVCKPNFYYIINAIHVFCSRHLFDYEIVGHSVIASCVFSLVGHVVQ
jgi:hypothetical protein